MKLPVVIDKETGEVLDLRMTKKEIEGIVHNMSDSEKASMYTKANFVRRKLADIETAIKNYIKKNVKLEFDDSNKFYFEDIQISRKSRMVFSEKTLLEEGTAEEIEFWKLLKSKYTRASEVISF